MDNMTRGKEKENAGGWLTYKDIDQSRYCYHHSASARGYASRKLDEEDYPAEPYEGEFGKGYVVHAPRWDTTRYYTKMYYIEKPTPEESKSED